jgi:hypothetical protein
VTIYQRFVLPPEREEEFRQLCKTANSFAEIATFLGLCRTNQRTVKRLMEERGYGPKDFERLRRKGRKKAGQAAKLIKAKQMAEEDAKLAQLWRAETPRAEIMRQLGMSANTLQRRRKGLKLPNRRMDYERGAPWSREEIAFVTKQVRAGADAPSIAAAWPETGFPSRSRETIDSMITRRKIKRAQVRGAPKPNLLKPKVKAVMAERGPAPAWVIGDVAGIKNQRVLAKVLRALKASGEAVSEGKGAQSVWKLAP